MRILGTENIPEAGPLLVVSNHVSAIDPLLMGAYFPRTLFAMAKQEIFRGPIARWWWRGCNVFPVNRGRADRAALRTAFGLLADGRRLLVFPEGTRSPTSAMIRVRPGVGFLARRSGAPILPVAIWGSDQIIGRHGLPRRVPVTVSIGQPMALTPDVPDDVAAAEQIAAAIAALLPPQFRGVYGGCQTAVIARD